LERSETADSPEKPRSSLLRDPITGDILRSRALDAQTVEATIACNILNRMLALGRPRSVSVGEWSRPKDGADHLAGD
jgi:hypothetical protein